MRHLLHSIKEPVVCSKCYDEVASGQTDAGSLQHYAALDVGFTDRGLQVWCRRHELNVVHVDFDGMALDADFRCLEKTASE
ncbi:MAG: hypothetical protein J4F41_01480 [Alphaproteobacteria bacterium]|nr:hypothetical protein [Alphaproteobacteria bacterium]